MIPKLDIFHETVERALEKDGWIISNDPLRLNIGKRNVYIDVGAERLLTAEKGIRKIAC